MSDDIVTVWLMILASLMVLMLVAGFIIAVVAAL